VLYRTRALHKMRMEECWRARSIRRQKEAVRGFGGRSSMQIKCNPARDGSKMGVPSFGRKEETTGWEAGWRQKYCCLEMWDMQCENMDLRAKRKSASRGEARRVFGMWIVSSCGNRSQDGWGTKLDLSRR